MPDNSGNTYLKGGNMGVNLTMNSVSRQRYPEPGWYFRLSQFFRERLGRPVYKIPLNAGFSCPNRDAATGKEGCIYCYNPSFSPCAANQALSVTEQLARGKRGKSAGKLYLAYFQSYSNTYGPLEKLKALYDEALSDPEIAGLSIATRPDCISEEVLLLLQGYARSRHIWLEYGLQSAHNSTLKRIKRGHSFEQFLKAVEMTRGREIFICAHVILGLPGETREMMLQTIDSLNRCAINGIKFHHLQVISGTPLAEQFYRGRVSVFDTASSYIPLLCDCLERLSPAVTVHRLAARVADCSLLLAPCWPESPTQIAAAVHRELQDRRSFQGSRCFPAP